MRTKRFLGAAALTAAIAACGGHGAEAESAPTREAISAATPGGASAAPGALAGTTGWRDPFAAPAGGAVNTASGAAQASEGTQQDGQHAYPQQPAYPQTQNTQYPQAQPVPQPGMGALPTMTDVPQGRTAMMDVNGFGQRVPAYSFVRPDGWRVDEATVSWSSQPCAGMVPMARLRLASPQGALIQSGGERAWVSGIGQMKMTMQQQGVPLPPEMASCPDGQVVNADQFLRQMASASRPGMTVVSARPRPDIVAKAQADIQKADALLPPDLRVAQYGLRFDAAELVIAYDGPTGRTEEVMLTALAQAPVPDAPFPMTMQVTSGIMSMTAPAGQLDKAALDRVWQTLEPLPAYAQAEAQKTIELSRMQDRQMRQWEQQAQARVRQFQKKRSGGRMMVASPGGMSGMNGVSSPGAAASPGNPSMNAFNNRMNAMDRMQTGTIDALTDTTTVYDPYNGYDVAVDGTGVDVWQTETGDIFTTDQNDYFDPVDAGMTGTVTKLDPVSSGGGDDFWGSNSSGITD